MNFDQQKIAFEKAGFKCAKCDFYSPMGVGLEIAKTENNGEEIFVLCNICATFAPLEEVRLKKYINEKIGWQSIETFRNSGMNRASHRTHRQGMIDKSKEGFLVARPPFGYRVEKGNLIVDEENSENVRLIFKEFSEGKSLNQLAKTYGISVNGIKKILKNFSYLGKVKFAGNILAGNHAAIISSELFNRVQTRFEKPKTN